MRVLLTGASGTVGTAVLDQLGDRPEYEFTCLDAQPHPDRETVVADVTDYDDVRPAFDGHDAVVHLAASPAITTPWPQVLRNNVLGTYNVLEAAADAGVPKFLFASSIHTVGVYEYDHAPDLYEPNYGLTVHHTDPVRPDSFYGVSKVFGEALGRFYVEGHEGVLGGVDPGYRPPTRDAPEQFYSIRILSVRGRDADHPYDLAERGVEDGRFERGSEAYELMADRLKATWLSHRDLGQLVDRCLQDEDVRFDVFWGVSDNRTRWVDLEHGRAVLGYRPVDDGSEWTAPPDPDES